MNFENFISETKEKLEIFVKNNNVEGEVVVREIVKNNDIHLKAISIVETHRAATPTIYLEPYYEEHCQGRSIEKIVEEIYELYCMNSGKVKMELDDFKDYNYVKDRIAFKVINYEQNRETLKHIPYIKVLDLAIVFFILVSDEERESATAMIRNEHIEMWETTKDDVIKMAFKNTPVLFPAKIQRMEDVLTDIIMGDIASDMDDSGCVKEDFCYGDYTYDQLEDYVREEIGNIKQDKDIEMYVLSNRQKINGAGTIFYKGILKDFAKEHNCNIFIIPSSVHEVILVPEGFGVDRESINEMILEVNETEVDPIEVLSDHVYIYTLADNTIHM